MLLMVKGGRDVWLCGGDWFASKMDETMNNGVLVCMCGGGLH